MDLGWKAERTAPEGARTNSGNRSSGEGLPVGQREQYRHYAITAPLPMNTAITAVFMLS
jgi:hypothetical protein